MSGAIVTSFADIAERIEARQRKHRPAIAALRGSSSLTTTSKGPIVVAAYRSGDRCGACGRSSWHVGRVTAQCAHCGNVLGLEHT